jgi:hypothetical protein
MTRFFVFLFFLYTTFAEGFEVINDLKDKEGELLPGGIIVRLYQMKAYEPLLFAIVPMGKRERINIDGLLEELECNDESQKLMMTACYMGPGVVQKHASDLTLEFKNRHKVTYVARHTKDDYDIVPLLGHEE